MAETWFEMKLKSFMFEQKFAMDVELALCYVHTMS